MSEMSELVVATVNEVLAKVASRGSQTVMLAPGPGNVWTPITGDELYGRVRALAEVLAGWGIGRGDRVAILSENRWEWAVSDFAVLALGGVDVPLYSTNTAEQVRYMIRDSGAKVAIVSSAEQMEKLVSAGELPELQHVLVMNAGEEGNADSFAGIMQAAAAKQTRDAAFDALVLGAKPEDLCTIIYTSGTTGEPKGVELTHGNLAANVSVGVLGEGLERRV